MGAGLTRAARIFVLGAWMAFFAWLIVSGDMYRYVGPRTYWVVWFGAAALVAAFLSQLFASESDHGAGRDGPASRLSLRQIASFGAILVPILLVIVVPTPTLGSSVAANKASAGITSATAFTPATFSSGGEVSFVEIEYASRSQEYSGRIGLYDGFPVSLTGFVTASGGGGSDGFTLTRFSILCCAADVIPHSVAIAPKSPVDFPNDTWLRVSGALKQMPDGEWVLEAESIERVAEPENPYL